MTKELFIETINAMNKQHQHDVDCTKAFRLILRDDFISGYDNSIITDQMLKILKTEFDDFNDWIDYYIYELDFGRKYKDGMVTSKNGEIIKLIAPEDLYELLNEKR